MPKRKPTPGEVAKSKFVAQRLLGKCDYFRGFHHTSEAYYAKTAIDNRDCEDEVMLGMYAVGGGAKGEMGVRWKNLGQSRPLTPQLQVFDDAWEVLYSFADVLEAMAKVDGQDISPNSFCNLLLQHGFKDITHRVREDAA